MSSTKQVLLHRLTQERATLFHAIAFMPEDELVCRPVIGEWSAKDILGHLSAWEGEIVLGIEQFLHGERPDLLDISDEDAWNGEQARQRWDLALAQVKQELVATRQRTLELVSTLADEAFQRPSPPPMKRRFVPLMLNAIADHDREHWAGLMAHKQAWVNRQQIDVAR